MSKKKRTEKDKNLRRYKYAMIYNVYQRDDVARAGRDLSFEKIYERFGIYIEPKKLYRAPKIQHPTKKIKDEETGRTKTIKVRRSYYKNYLNNRLKGYDTETAFNNRKHSRLKEIIIDIIPDQPVEDWFSSWDYNNRVEDWKRWSSSKNAFRFPGWLTEFARSYNYDLGMKANARYGFAVMYYRYVQRWDEESTLKFINPDPTSVIEYKYNEEWRIK